MGSKTSKVSNVADEMGNGGKATGSVIDKLTEAQLDEFREAFNSFDKVRVCGAHTQPGCGHGCQIWRRAEVASRTSHAVGR